MVEPQLMKQIKERVRYVVLFGYRGEVAFCRGRYDAVIHAGDDLRGPVGDGVFVFGVEAVEGVLDGGRVADDGERRVHGLEVHVHAVVEADERGGDGRAL